jgi:HAD superfamily hydrolase (TIGR01490 family)
LSLAIFDLDNTLLGGDSDYLWGEFLVSQGLVDGDDYRQRNARFYDDYKAGTLDIYEFLAFSLKPLTEHSLERLQELHRQFMAQAIEPIVQTKALELVDSHRQRGDTLLIITATNRFVTEPIATRFGIDNLLATDPEMVDSRYTGAVQGVPCFKEGKVTRLTDWLSTTQHDLEDSWFYSDSHNDLPLLNMVTHPVAVDPDPQLTNYARQHDWPIISLHDEPIATP